MDEASTSRSLLNSSEKHQLTVADMDVAPLPFGVVNPVGVVMMRLVEPVVTGWNAVVVD